MKRFEQITLVVAVDDFGNPKLSDGIGLEIVLEAVEAAEDVTVIDYESKPMLPPKLKP